MTSMTAQGHENELPTFDKSRITS